MQLGETYTASANFFSSGIRTVFSTLDRPAYWLLEMVYQLFFNVASADIFAGGMITKFYGRVQLIISVFMMFQLALTILRGIMNPDSFTDSKSGVGNFVYRVAVALVLLTLMVPINTGGNNEFDKQINNNGLLFGTLYSLQHRILANNTLGKLIMGTTDSDSNYMSSSSDTENLKAASRIFTTTVLRGFYRINLLPEEQRPKHEKGKDDAVFNANRICQNIDDNILDAYTRLDADPGDIIGMVNETCEPDSSIISRIRGLASGSGSKKYVFTYMPFIPTVVGFVFAFIILSFAVDVAVRAVKLAVLRLIAPVPIIAYMNPKGTQDSAFNAWVKTLTSTYLDLFIRLASVYFVIALIQGMIAHGIYINRGDGMLGILSLILIWFGLFIFAKQAPRFIKEVLGLKQDVGNLFGGFGEIMAVGAAGLGTIGSFATNYRAAAEESEQLYPNHKFLGTARNVGSAIAGAIGGGYVGAKALMGKDASAKSVLAAQSQRNANRAGHSTLPGRIMDSAYGMVAGVSLADKGNKRLKGAQDWVKAQGSWKSALEEEAKGNGAATDLGEVLDSNHNRVQLHATYRDLERAVATAENGLVTLNGRTYESNSFTKKYMDDALKAQVFDYQVNGNADGDSYATLKSAGNKLFAKYNDVVKAAGDVDVTQLKDDVVKQHWRDYNPDNSKTFGPAIGAANNVISDEQNNMQQIMRRANNQQKK